MKHALAYWSCVLRQKNIVSESYESELIPWIHFVPVKYDLSDLGKKNYWALQNDALCEEIGKQATIFAQEHGFRREYQSRRA